MREREGEGERYNERERGERQQEGGGDSWTDRQTYKCTNDIRYAILSL